MHMVTKLSRKVVVVMVFRNGWAAEERQLELKVDELPYHPGSWQILCGLTLIFRHAVHLQVRGGETEFVSVPRGQVVLLEAAAHTEAAAHGGDLAVKLLPCDFMVKAQPAKLNLHAVSAEEEREEEQGNKRVIIKALEWRLYQRNISTLYDTTTTMQPTGLLTKRKCVFTCNPCPPVLGMVPGASSRNSSRRPVRHKQPTPPEWRWTVSQSHKSPENRITNKWNQTAFHVNFHFLASAS